MKASAKERYYGLDSCYCSLPHEPHFSAPLLKQSCFLVSTTLVRHPVGLCESIGVCCPSLRPGVDMKDDVELRHIFSQ